MIALRNAISLAYVCRTGIELPQLNIVGKDVFDLSVEYQSLDFSSVPGAIWSSSRCRTDIQGDVKYFHAFSEPQSKVTDKTDLMFCLKHYLGMCQESYCQDQELTDDTLVVHLRQGVAFQHDAPVHPLYGQPPLSFYFAIISFTKPQVILLISESDTIGPIWAAFRLFAKHQFAEVTIKFQSSTFREDFRTMICARQLVESRSSLTQVLRFGNAKKTFSTACFVPFFFRSGQFRRTNRFRLRPNTPCEPYKYASRMG